MATSGPHSNTLASISDRRHYPAHHHPRHPAPFPSLTEFPDSPSVYSHVYHSPDTDMLSDTASFSDTLDSAEFDDETASTIRSLSAEDVQDDSDVGDSADDVSHRISLPGPKIRFHSRAPWEIDDAIPHGEESDNSSPSAAVRIGNRFKGKSSKTDSLIRTFTRGSSITSRPSVDSQVSVTSSFEITAGNYSSSRGALYDLARQMSTSSLSSTTSSPMHRESFASTTNYSKPSHYFTQTRAVSLDEVVPSSMTPEGTAVLPSSGSSRVSNEYHTKSSLATSVRRPSRDKFIHPYANPDLVTSYTPSLETTSSQHSISRDMSGSDSNSTLTDSASTRSAAFSVSSNETSSSSLTSRDPPHGNPRVNGKEISSPVSVLHQGDMSYIDRHSKFLSLHPPPPCFDGRLRSNLRTPAVALISLQDAQAMDKIRSDTVHTSIARSKPPLSDPDAPETTGDQAGETHTAGILARTRARSTSIGARHKVAPLPPSQPQVSGTGDESIVAIPTSTTPRTLKHKKSGFMRLFSGRNLEGDRERCTPPPIPPLADVYAEQNLQTHGTEKIPNIMSTKTPKLSPTLSPPNNAMLVSAYSAPSGGDGPDGTGLSLRRRQPPPLSIVTRTPNHTIPTSLVGQRSLTGLNFSPPPPQSLTVPQSAPPGNTDFPGLKLRPVSTSFSSHFAGFVAGAVEEAQHDAHTLSSSSSSGTTLFPFTPVSMRRSDDASVTAVKTPGEEHLAIKELQNQLAAAKKAWQQQIWELHGQIRDLTSELEDLRAADNLVYCEVCGRGEPQRHHVLPSDEQQSKKVSIVNRPRARTGDAARFASGN